MLSIKKVKALFAIVAVLSAFLPSAPIFAAEHNTLTCAGYSVTIKNDSPSLMLNPNLKISKPQIIAVDTDASCAVVVWNTSSISTSQVIFAKSDEKVRLDLLNADQTDFWGYSAGSAENAKAESYHVMIINNLEKGVEYKLRAVSRSTKTALPAVSEEMRFRFERIDSYQNNKSDTADSTDNAGATDITGANNTENAALTNAGNTVANNTAANAGSQKDLARLFNARVYGNGTFDFEKFETSAGKSDLTEKENSISEKSTVEGFAESNADQEEENSASTGVGEDKALAEVIGAANAGDTAVSLWGKIKDFFSSLFGGETGKDDNDNNDDNDDNKKEETGESKTETVTKNDEISLEGDSDDKASLKIEVKDGNENDDSSVLINEKEKVSVAVVNKVTKSENGQEKKSLSASVKNGVDDVIKKGSEKIQNTGSIFAKYPFLLIILPVLAILVALYFLKDLISGLISKKFDLSDESFWMTSFAVLGIFFALLKIVPLALAFLALFLMAFAWYLFQMAISDMEQNGAGVDDGDVELVKNNGESHKGDK